jgi:hypothetical protein
MEQLDHPKKSESSSWKLKEKIRKIQNERENVSKIKIRDFSGQDYNNYFIILI